eukprot:XP_020396550.1 uncharacterized protein LOC109940764 [Zea mays]
MGCLKHHRDGAGWDCAGRTKHAMRRGSGLLFCGGKEEVGVAAQGEKRGGASRAAARPWEREGAGGGVEQRRCAGRGAEHRELQAPKLLAEQRSGHGCLYPCARETRDGRHVQELGCRGDAPMGKRRSCSSPTPLEPRRGRAPWGALCPTASAMGEACCRGGCRLEQRGERNSSAPRKGAGSARVGCSAAQASSVPWEEGKEAPCALGKKAWGRKG